MKNSIVTTVTEVSDWDHVGGANATGLPEYIEVPRR